MQQELKLGPMPMAELRFLPWDQIAQCGDEQDAILLSWQSRRPRCSVEKGASRMGVSKGTLSKYLNGKLGLSPDRQRAFQNVVGNCAITQYDAYANGCMLTRRELSEAEKQARELQALRARVRELESAA